MQRTASRAIRLKTLTGAKSTAGRDMVKARSGPQRQRRLLTRLSVSANTLLRLALGLPHPGAQHNLPVRPSVAVELLRLLASGASPGQLVGVAESLENKPEDTSTLSEVSEPEVEPTATRPISFAQT